MLELCFKPDCPHLVCASGRTTDDKLRFTGGPPLSYFPLAIPDDTKPWGAECEQCSGDCAGHYLKPEEAWASFQQHGEKIVQKDPPPPISYFETCL